MTLLLVVAGAAVGAPLRYLTDRAMQGRYGSRLPWGTFTVNVAGSLVMGVLAGGATVGAVSDSAIALIGTGLCGALTTYSTRLRNPTPGRGRRRPLRCAQRRSQRCDRTQRGVSRLGVRCRDLGLTAGINTSCRASQHHPPTAPSDTPSCRSSVTGSTSTGRCGHHGQSWPLWTDRSTCRSTSTCCLPRGTAIPRPNELTFHEPVATHRGGPACNSYGARRTSGALIRHIVGA